MSLTASVFAFLLVGLLVAAPACGQHAMFGFEGKRASADVEAKIKALTDQMEQCVTAHDSDCYLNVYSDSVITMPEGHPYVVGKDEAKKHLSWISIVDTVSITTDELISLGPNADTVLERYSLKITATDGKVMVDGKGLLVWQKDNNGDYKVHITIYNSNSLPSSGN